MVFKFLGESPTERCPCRTPGWKRGKASEQVAQRYAPFAFLCGSSLTVIEASNPGVFIGGQQHPVDFEPARRGDGALDAARVVMRA